MESEIMIEITKIYVDKDGAGRLYIPKEILVKLNWKNKEKLLINENNSILVVKSVKEGVI